MRSRYTAYFLGGQGAYLLKTWFPVTASGVTAEELSQRTLQWQGLDILSASQDADSGQVEFIARYQDAEGKPGQLHEKSVFQRVAGRWFYVGGEVSNQAGQSASVGRNEPCPCGSNRKYKHCCGK